MTVRRFACVENGSIVLGQYFNIANITKREYLDPHCFGDGLKLMEFGCSSEGTLLGLTLLLRSSDEGGGGDFRLDDDEHAGAWERVGSWTGDRIVICGDYDAPGKWIDGELVQHPNYAAIVARKQAYNDEHGTTYPVTPNLYELCGPVFRNISAEIIEIAQLGSERIRFAEGWSNALDYDPERRDRIRARGARYQGDDGNAITIRPDMLLVKGS